MQGMWLLKKVSAPGSHAVLLVWGRDAPAPAGVTASFCQFFQESISRGQTWLAGLPDANTGILSFHQ